MKHPFQIVITDKSGKHLFVSVKNTLRVYDLEDGKTVGSWVDTVDIFTPLKKQQEEKIKKLQAEAAESAETESDDSKKLKTNSSGAIKIPKIPVPGPGAPPIYNYIRSLSLSPDEKFLIGTTDSDKAAIIFEIDFTKENCLNLIKRQIIPKRPCAVSIDEQTLIVADKFGDVYCIPIDNVDVDEKSLSPILGHVSMLSEVLITSYNGKKFVLTGDRDEHIKISNYPKAYVVKSWLFGHREFVSSLHIPDFDPSLLISGGGDEFICLWKWYDNKLLTKFQLRDILEPFLTEEHFPPERFRTETSPKEIAISKILTYQSPLSNSKYIIVLCENTKCLNVLKLGDDYSVSHFQTLQLSNSLTDICLDAKNEQIIGALDTESEDSLLEFYKFNNKDELEIYDNSEVVRNISTGNECDVESRSDFYPLYYINSLRKRSDH